MGYSSLRYRTVAGSREHTGETALGRRFNKLLCRSGIFFVLTFALLAQSAWGQRLGPLVKDNQQRSKAAAVQPPSLQLSLPSPAVAALSPLGPDDLQLLQPQEGRPPVIGVHRRLPPGAVTQSFSGGAVKTTAEGAWQSTAAGRLWRLRITAPSARAMRIHFRDFAIGAGSLWLHSPSGQVVGPYSGSGLYGDGNFWSGIVFGDSLTIEYLPDPAATEEAVPFQIVEISHIWDDAFGSGGEAGVQPPIAASGEARTGREALKPLTDRINVVVGRQAMEQSPAADNPPDTKTARLAKQIQLVERSASLDHPLPKAATSLSPGKSTTFSVGPVDNSTIFIGDGSFQLLVPESATSVTVTLESSNDMGLYVRYGEDNDLQNGRVVSDYASRESTGNEEIVITPQSDPPLRAGTYFVSIALFDTGVVAEGTLTAEVEPDGVAPPPTSGNTLTPGQPVSFQRGPTNTPPTIYFGSNSFRLEVPEDASRVTFTLESDVDVELFVRYGEDNAVQDRSLVTDHRSRNPAGNERILITPRSDPPLRAGTYFVSVGVRATGVVANCTLTAEVELEGETRPTISGGMLTPGQPADFRLGPVESPRLFSGDDSFRLEVSENASRVIFTLESVDPDVDVALYVRFGEDNTVQDRSLVTDHRSRNPEGNERIGITRRSDPPLRAGTYFVSVLVFDTGVVAEGPITATVETDAMDCHLDVTCYPEWSSSATGVAQIFFETSEGSFSCSGTLLNNRRQDLTPYFLTAAHCVATEEEARSVIAFWHYQTQTCNGELPDFLSVPRTMGARLLSTLGDGTIEGRAHPDGDMTLLRLEGDLPDGVMFQGWDADPQPIGAQVTGIHHPGSDDWGFFKRIAFGQIIPNPDYETSDDVYAIVRYTQGVIEGGSSGSALFSSPETVVGVQSFGPQNVYDCSDAPFYSGTTHFSVFYPHIRQFIDKEFAGTESILLANFVNGNTDAFNSRVYLWNPSGSSGDVTVRVFTLPLTGGLAQELTTAPLNLGTLDARSALNIKLAEDILTPLGITTPYTTDGGNLTLEFTIEVADVRGATQVFSSSLAFGTHPLQEIPSTSSGSPTVLVANFMNGNTDAFNSRAYLFNPSDSDGNVTVRVFTLPLSDGTAQELTGTPLDLGTLEARSALNIKLVEDILIPLGIALPYTTDGGNLTLEFTIQAADVRGTAQVFSSSFAFGTYPLQQLPLVSVGTPTGLVANFMNGNNTAFNSRVYLWNPSESSGDVTVRVFTLPLTGGLAQELTTAPLNLGTLGAKSALNVKLVENILAPLGITLPYTTDGGNLTLEFTIQAADVRGAAQVFSSSFAFGTYPLQNVELITDGGDVPPTPLAPADEAAFNTLFVGKRAVTNYPTVYVDFVSPGRFRETEGSETSTGSYTYRNTGSNTGTLTLNYDDGDRCTVSLTFDSTTAGTASYTCNDGSSGEYNWQLVETPQLQVTMSASPTSIERGQSATLRWSSTNATSAAITPGIGTVPTSGSRGVSPTSTTAYLITVRGADGQTASASATVTVTEPPPTKPFNQLQTERC